MDPGFQTVTQMVACCKNEQVMSESKRKNFNGEFKAKVALEATRHANCGNTQQDTFTKPRNHGAFSISFWHIWPS